MMASSPNLDLVRSIYAEWERGDFSSAEWAHPDIEYVWADGPAPGSWTGLAGMAEAARGMFNAWSEYRVEALEYRELADDRVLVFTRMSGRGRASGLELEQIGDQGAELFEMHAGKVARIVVYFDRNRVLSDLGLEE
jgi:ketosteroid isomerase-like protein